MNFCLELSLKLAVASQTVTAPVPEPEEKKPAPDQLASYSVPANEPRNIRIDSTGVAGLIQKVGKTAKTFTVVDVKKLHESEFAAYLFTGRTDVESQLNLITCGGKFDPKTQTFDNRIIIVAKLAL